MGRGYLRHQKAAIAMYGLCDCNNFFVSCERLFRPDLDGRPVVVLSNNDGCVIARSNEAKALGIRMGHPYFQLRELIERHDVAVFSGNMALYGDLSRRVIGRLRQLVPAAEVYSIDEAFIDFGGIAAEELDEMGHRIGRTIRRDTGIPVSIGIAPTKTLAKIASKLCKHYPKLRGACFMHRPEDIDKVLGRFPVGDVWGIGRRHRAMLQAAGVVTARDLAGRSEAWVRGRMGITGVRTWRELHGEACIDFETAPAARQQISVSRSFAREVEEFDTLHASAAAFVASCAEKLRRQRALCGSLTVYILTNRHRDDLPQYYESATLRPAVATDDTLELTLLVREGLERIFRRGYGYKKAGVVLSDIIPREGAQSDLFDPVDRVRRSRLMEALDAANGRLGSRKIVIAAQTLAPVPTNRAHLSPAYTTDWDQLPVVKAR